MEASEKARRLVREFAWAVLDCGTARHATATNCYPSDLQPDALAKEAAEEALLGYIAKLEADNGLHPNAIGV